MEIIEFNDICKVKFSECIATIGVFDGIHLGHKLLFKMLDENKDNYKKMVITFKTNPDYSLLKKENNGDLDTFENKIAYFKSEKIDYVVLLSSDVLGYTYQRFNDKVLKKLGVKRVIVGEDFVYGHNIEGNIGTLKKDFDVIVCDNLKNKQGKLSSQNIRDFLLIGDVSKVKEVLGTNFKLSGIVQKGAGLGSKLGFPTANIALAEKTFKIASGVYAAYIYIEKNRYLGVVNVGVNPTINTQKFPRIEAHIIDFNDDLYGKNITIEFLKLIRKEIKFENTQMLIETVKENIETVKKGYNI